MKTIQIVESEIRQIRELTKEGKKPNTDVQVEALRLLRLSDDEFIKREYKKVIEQKKSIESKFDEYFANFTAFKVKDEHKQKQLVKKEFKKVFEIAKIDRRIKVLKYIVE